MSEIKALEKLRECAEHSSEGWFVNLEQAFGLRRYKCGNSTVKPDGGAILNAIADEIQAEVDSRFMELPLDADGVPIRVGDVVAAQDEQPFEVRAFQLDALGWFAIERLGSQWNVNQLHHVKTRKVAAEIRELLGVDV